MVLTRSQSRAAFNHVLDNVLHRGDDSGLKQALVSDGYADIESLINIRHGDIDDLTYDKTATEVDVPVKRGDKSLLCIFQDYVTHRNMSSDPIEGSWTTITSDQFNTFRVDPSYNPNGGPASGSSHAPPATPPSTRYSPADVFRRGIKCDPTLFLILKDERFNDSWHRSFTNQAHAQGVIDVLDAAYMPSSPEQIELFAEKKKYLYVILEKNILTDRGKAIVRDH